RIEHEIEAPRAVLEGIHDHGNRLASGDSGGAVVPSGVLPDVGAMPLSARKNRLTLGSARSLDVHHDMVMSRLVGRALPNTGLYPNCHVPRSSQQRLQDWQRFTKMGPGHEPVGDSARGEICVDLLARGFHQRAALLGTQLIKRWVHEGDDRIRPE